MISDNCSIDEFVEAVKSKPAWEVISLAIDDATQADRMFIRNLARFEKPLHCGQQYSCDLKQLINYLRSAVKLKRPLDKAYRLYMAHWGTPEQEGPSQLPETVH